jgi:hypothetical protein
MLNNVYKQCHRCSFLESEVKDKVANHNGQHKGFALSLLVSLCRN